MNLNEKHFETLVIEKFLENGWSQINDIERVNTKEVIDWGILKNSIKKINKTSLENSEKAIDEIKKILDNAVKSNIKGFNFIKNGIPIFDSKLKRTLTIRLVSNEESDNVFNVVRQFKISNGESLRIVDVVAFVNGMPISIIELKDPLANERIEDAFKQNESLKFFSPSLFIFNLLNVVSNRLTTKYGSITYSIKRYFKTLDWSDENNFVKALFNKKNILEIIKTFSFFDNFGYIKFLAARHQKEAVDETIKKLLITKDNKGGVVWHTQGSGKSVTMLILSRAILNLEKFSQSTIIVVTDRKTLDNQLFERFSKSSKYLRCEPKQISSRKELVSKLKDKKHFDIFFTTVQKFYMETGILSSRNDIFVIVDEAHRTQNNIEGEKYLSKSTKEFITKFGYARYMREAFPNAKLIGFTGTPLMGMEKETTSVFGGYNHIYSMNDSVRDESTVPILYESRKVDIKLDANYLKQMDLIQHEYAKTLDQDDIQSKQKMDSLIKSINIKLVLENKEVIATKVRDILKHLNTRAKILHGKAMVVASTRKAAYHFYNEIIKQQPSREKSTILVVTHSNKDSEEMNKAIVPKAQMDVVSSEFRKTNSKYKIAIVVDMWLTGFDVPDLDVMYIDKIIKWHNLMQAIARVNRTYDDDKATKESGLIVDYLGIWQFLAEALTQYASGGDKKFEIMPNDINKAKIKLLDLIDVVDKNYLANIKSFNELDSKQKYTFIMNSLEKIMLFDTEERTKFIKIARKIKRLFKIAFTVIDQKISTIAKATEMINSLISTKNTIEDEELKITIEGIKNLIKQTIDSSTTDVIIKTAKISKEINEVAKLLEEEATEIRRNNPLVAKKLLEDAINARINFIKKIRPIYAKKVSQKLKEIISKVENQEKVDLVIDKLIQLAKEVKEKLKEKPEYEDPQMQSFYTILADDKFLKKNKSSEVLRKIAEELIEIAKVEYKEGADWITQTRLDKIEYSLRKILKNKYNYPPKGLNAISKILIDKINGTIEENPHYFAGRKVDNGY